MYIVLQTLNMFVNEVLKALFLVLLPFFIPANTITPTVELNALAMKRGEPAIYKPFEHRLPFYPPNPHAYDYRGYYNQR